jgi:branched-chain amino acid transport system ATP-binding protein
VPSLRGQRGVRDRVPSERERAVSGVPADQTTTDDELVVESRRQKLDVKGALQTLDPRGIAGPGLMAPLLVVGLLQTVGQFDSLLFRAVLPFIKVDLDFSFNTLFSILGLITFISLITAPLGGFVADRISRVWMVRVGAFIENVFTTAIALAPGAGALIGARSIAQLGPAIYQPAMPSLVADYFPVEKRARVQGLIIFVQQAWGAVVGITFIVGLIFLGISWRVLLFGAGSLAFVVTLLTFLLKEPVRGEADRLSLGMSAEAAKVVQKPVSFSESYRIARNIGTLRRMWYAEPFLYVTQVGIGTLLFFAIQQKVAEQEGAGLIGAIGTVIPRFGEILPFFFILFPAMIGLVLTPFATQIADRLVKYDPGRLLIAYAVLTGLQMLSLVGILIIPDVFIGVLVSFIMGAVAALLNPARILVLQLVVPARIRSFGIQTIQVWQLGGVLLLPVIGRFADTRGPDAAIFALVPFTLIATVLLMTAGADVEKDIRNALLASAADEDIKRARLQGVNKMLVCRGLEVSFGGTPVLRGVDLDIDEGELIAILGTNGAGKSTLLRAVAGLETPSAGAIFLDSEDVTTKAAHLNAGSGVVFMPGGKAVFPSLTVQENLTAAAWLYRQEPEYVERRTAEVLEMFPVLTERLAVRAGDLSGGEQQMLALSQAFLMRPRILMIDELSLGLAPQVVEQLLAVVREVNALGTTVVLVEQSINVALTIAQRAVFLDEGQVRFDGTTEELLERDDLVKAAFLGSGGRSYSGFSPRRQGGVELDPVLTVRGASVRYGGMQALQDVSLEVRPGEVVALIGPNGAGKTSLFDAISGFTTLTEGSVLLDDTDVTELAPDERARVGLVRSFQECRLFPSLTVREVVGVALERQLETRSAAMAAVWAPTVREAERKGRKRVDTLLAELGLSEHADAFASELSTGTRRLVELACVMASEPRVLLLDEPSSGLAQREVELLGRSCSGWPAAAVRRPGRRARRARWCRPWPTGWSRWSSARSSPPADRRGARRPARRRLLPHGLAGGPGAQRHRVQRAMKQLAKGELTR